jgi:CheY-like chemotaxis protein
MPIMNGVTATLILRRHGIHVPIVGVTGNTLDDDLQSFTNAGANEILVSNRQIQISRVKKTSDWWALSTDTICAPLFSVLCRLNR